MLQLDFNTFIERYKIQLESSGAKPTLHYLEDNKKFTLYFKNFEHWEYFTEISKSTIIEFGGLYQVNPDQAINDFRINYLTHAVELTVKEVEIIVPEVLGAPSQEINKMVDVNTVIEAKDYEDFFIKTVDKWHERILEAIKQVDTEKMYTPEFDKSFTDFLKDLMNSINTKGFLTRLAGFIKGGLMEGKDAASQEASVTISWDESFDQKVLSLQHQQLEGYTVNGEKWFGIKGATKDLQMNILNTVSEDVRNKQTQEDIAKHINEIFDGSTMSQAKRIARTETTRFVNEGKLTSYKTSGIKGKKSWDVVPKKCCEICDRLHDKYVEGIPFDKSFEDSISGWSGQNPPAHPHCRCVISYKPLV